MRTTFESSVFLLLTVQGTSCTQEQQSCDAREGVFFAKEQFPSTGVVANKLSTPAELAERVASWKTAYTPGPLTRAQHAQFFDEGFVIVSDLLPFETTQGAIDAVEMLVDNLAKSLHSAGKITRLHEDAGFQQRLVRLEDDFPHANVLLHKHGVLPDGIARVWSNPVLMGVAQQLLGDVDIAGHPVA